MNEGSPRDGSSAMRPIATMPLRPPRATSIPAVLLTPEEAAEALRVSRSKVYDLMRSGRLHSVKIGGSRRVPVAALDDFVRALRGAA